MGQVKSVSLAFRVKRCEVERIGKAYFEQILRQKIEELCIVENLRPGTLTVHWREGGELEVRGLTG